MSYFNGRTETLHLIGRYLETLFIATSDKSRPKLFGRDYIFLLGVLETQFNIIDKLDYLVAGALFDYNLSGKDSGLRGGQGRL